VPRSDSGRAAARGWSVGSSWNHHSGVSCRVLESWARNAWLELFSTDDPTTPALAEPAPAPPQPGGSKTSNSQLAQQAAPNQSASKLAHSKYVTVFMEWCTKAPVDSCSRNSPVSANRFAPWENSSISG